MEGKHEVYFKTPVSPLTHEEQVLGSAYLLTHAGMTSYGYWHLFVLFLRKWFRYRIFSYSQKDMVCSHFVAAFYDACGRRLTAKELPANTPLDILDSAHLQDL